MLRIAFLCSGGGGNLRFIQETIRLGLLPDAVICGVIADRECPAGLFASKNAIPLSILSFRKDEDEALERTLISLRPDIIISNVHKILSPSIVNQFCGKIINLHYSLLPAFGGLIGSDAVRRALEYGAKFVGATVHFVDQHLDAGVPIVQAAIPITRDEDAPRLMDAVFQVGCISLLSGIRIVRRDRIGSSACAGQVHNIFDRAVMFSPPADSHPEFTDQLFWRNLK